MDSMKKFNILVITAIAAISVLSCTGAKTEIPDQDQQDQNQDQDQQEEEWTGDYPKGVSVEPFSENFSDGKVANGWVATIDFKANPRLKFNSLQASKRKAPTDFFKDFNQEKGTPYICVNAGYFAGSTSLSLCIIEGRVRSISPVDVN